MTFFPSLPDDAGVRHILTFNPAAGRALIDFHSAALRNPSRLTPAGVKGNPALYADRGRALRDDGHAPLLSALPPV
jgi:hypothetical protein